jgi:hypothetical protein
MKNSENLHKQAEKLLQKAQISAEIKEIAPVRGGGNNQAHKIGCDKASYLLKTYFFHPDDPRDRLQHEFSFSSYAWNQGIQTIARPLADSPQTHQGLYAFIEGRKLTKNEINIEKVDECAQFFALLNENKHNDEAKALPTASEAYFSVADHLKGIKKRIQRLKNIHTHEKIDQQAEKFIKKALEPTAKRLFDDILASKLEKNRILSLRERCLSPSDFGFHNALLDSQNHIRFIDFEYAGWDDPAKMVSDFFSQPAIPVPPEFSDHFIEKILEKRHFDAQIRLRIHYLLPLYRIKWCCIILNEFVRTDAERRAHALGDAVSRKKRQLELAEQHLAGIQALCCLHT